MQNLSDSDKFEISESRSGKVMSTILNLKSSRYKGLITKQQNLDFTSEFSICNLTKYV
jgi:hypothetical protein